MLTARMKVSFSRIFRVLASVRFIFLLSWLRAGKNSCQDRAAGEGLDFCAEAKSYGPEYSSSEKSVGSGRSFSKTGNLANRTRSRGFSWIVCSKARVKAFLCFLFELL